MPLAPSKPRVLVVDDEESLRLGLAKGLARSGFDTAVAASGREGVDAFAGGGFDAVLTDVRLPDLSGLDVVAILTEMDADVPVVVMTGYGTLDTALEALRRGAKDYVQKPFSVEDVGRLLTRAIEERRLARENRRLRALVERRLASSGYEQVEAELASRKEAEGTVAKARTAPGDGRVGSHPAPPAPPGPLPLREAQRRFEIDYVGDLLARTGGNVAAAARLAGISRPNFHKKLRSLGVDPGAFKQAARRGHFIDGGKDGGGFVSSK
jgi:DNA-binding NtrC family response regulator